MTRFAHRIKTHARGWRHHQPTPGVYLWRTPHGYWYHVDNTGTRPLGPDPDLTAYASHQPRPTTSQQPARAQARKAHPHRVTRPNLSTG